MNDFTLITKEVNDTTYYSTLSVYKAIGNSSHHKLKSKAAKLNLDMVEDIVHGSMLSHAALKVLLEGYRGTLKGQTLSQVEQLLGQLGQSGTPKGQIGTLEVHPKEQEGQMGTVQGQSGTPEEQSKGQQEQTGTKSEQSGAPNVNVSTPSVHELYSGRTQALSPISSTTTEQVLNRLTHFLSLISSFIKTEQFLMLVLVSAICIQINHIANLFYHTSSNPSWATWLGAYLFGTVSELTALLLTIHQGQTKILKAFAWLSFWINLLYYQVWSDFNGTLAWWMTLTVKVTLSGLIAYVIFSYAHLFAIGEGEAECE